jgi:hypothetical protein
METNGQFRKIALKEGEPDATHEASFFQPSRFLLNSFCS